MFCFKITPKSCYVQFISIFNGSACSWLYFASKLLSNHIIFIWFPCLQGLHHHDCVLLQKCFQIILYVSNFLFRRITSLWLCGALKILLNNIEFIWFPFLERLHHFYFKSAFIIWLPFSRRLHHNCILLQKCFQIILYLPDNLFWGITTSWLCFASIVLLNNIVFTWLPFGGDYIIMTIFCFKSTFKLYYI